MVHCTCHCPKRRKTYGETSKVSLSIACFYITLHSEIGDVHRLAADVDYFLSCEVLRTLSSEIRNKKYNN